MALAHCAIGLSAVCDCGISWSSIVCYRQYSVVVQTIDSTGLARLIEILVRNTKEKLLSI